MPALIDISGQRFGRLVALDLAGENPTNHHSMWRCVCDCGNITICDYSNLKYGTTKSCGCLREELRPSLNYRHGLCYTKLYHVWSAMKDRCYNKNCAAYEDYGKRGISVCDEWRSDFKAFYDWSMNHGYTEGLSIDRINNDGSYSPENCRWATRKEQVNNRSNNLTFTYKGITHTLAEWSEIYGINASTLHDRVMRLGYSFEEAISKPMPKIIRSLTYKGKTQSLIDWSKELNIPYGTLKSRLNKLHWTVEEALTGVKKEEN